MTGFAVPLYYLYGEPHRLVHADFVHIETIDERTRPGNWTIREHAHAELNHIFCVAKGAGELRAEDQRLCFMAPALLIVPAGTAHGFAWRQDSAGTVVTVATAYLNQLCERDADLARLFAQVAVIAPPRPEADEIQGIVGALGRELGWARLGHRAAIEAGLLGLMVKALRGLGPSPGAVQAAPGPQLALVARFRERVEARFHLREPIESHAGALAVSLYQLRTACTRVAGMPPAAIIDQRTILEAKRALLYSRLSIGEIAFSLGFTDSAYFSRFFHRHAGVSPRDFRG